MLNSYNFISFTTAVAQELQGPFGLFAATTADVLRLQSGRGEWLPRTFQGKISARGAGDVR